MIKNNIIVIHIDSVRREYLSSWILGQKFKENGFHVMFTSRHSTKRLLKYFSPKIFITTHAFTINYNLIKSIVLKGTHIYINEVEGVDFESGVMSTYPEYIDNQKVDYNLFSGIFVWNQFTHNWLLKNKVIDKEKIFLSGSIRQSKYCYKKNEKRKKPIIGFLSRFELINTYDNRHLFDNLKSIDPEDKNITWWYERISIDSEVFSIFYKLISKLIENGYKISIRPHPNENKSSYENLKSFFGESFIIDNSISINEWLSKVDVIFGTTSSAFTEAYLNNIPVISSTGIQNFKFHKNKEYTNLLSKFEDFAYLPKTINEAYEFCVNDNLMAKRSKKVDYFLNDFYSLKNGIDPIDYITKIISKKRDKSNLFTLCNFFSKSIFLIIIDFLLVLKYLIIKRSSSKLSAIINYNYNRLFHKPNSFMKNLLSEKF